MSARPPAPGALGVVQQFLNTIDYETGVETLVDARALAAWLAERRLFARPGEEPPPTPALDDAALARVLVLRTALRTLAEANAGHAEPAAAYGDVNAIAASVPLALRFDPDTGPLLTPLGDGVDVAIGWLLAITFDAMNTGEWARLKICPADDCRWSFYDSSRNRTGTWCSMAVCGNRAKVRSYQRRQREAKGTSGA